VFLTLFYAGLTAVQTYIKIYKCDSKVLAYSNMLQRLI